MQSRNPRRDRDRISEPRSRPKPRSRAALVHYKPKNNDSSLSFELQYLLFLISTASSSFSHNKTYINLITSRHNTSQFRHYEGNYPLHWGKETETKSTTMHRYSWEKFCLAWLLLCSDVLYVTTLSAGCFFCKIQNIVMELLTDHGTWKRLCFIFIPV